MSRRTTTPEEDQAVERETVAAEAAWLGREPGNEPWVPEGAWVPRVGDRVRVLVNLECQSCTTRNREDSLMVVHGATGVIECTSDARGVPYRHDYRVRFDQPIPARQMNGRLSMAWGMLAAAIELVPLAPERRDGGDA